jgi:hypothetical protein
MTKPERPFVTAATKAVQLDAQVGVGAGGLCNDFFYCRDANGTLPILKTSRELNIRTRQ